MAVYDLILGRKKTLKVCRLLCLPGVEINCVCMSAFLSLSLSVICIFQGLYSTRQLRQSVLIDLVLYQRADEMKLNTMSLLSVLESMLAL